MPSTSARARRPTLEDLDEEQREIYEALPTEELKQKFLKRQPPISLSGASARRKAQQIRARIVVVERVVQGLQAHKEQLAHLAKELEQGRHAPDAVDLRQTLKPPAIPGITLRFERK